MKASHALAWQYVWQRTANIVQPLTTLFGFDSKLRHRSGHHVVAKVVIVTVLDRGVFGHGYNAPHVPSDISAAVRECLTVAWRSHAAFEAVAH